MKLKASASRNLPEPLLGALNGSSVADAFRDLVAVPYLHVDPASFGAATHYVQETDLIIPTSDGKMGVEVTLSKVSVNDRRSPQDYRDALKALQLFYLDLIADRLRVGQEAQLFCVLALDAPVKFSGQEPSSLIELPPIMIKGRCH